MFFKIITFIIFLLWACIFVKADVTVHNSDELKAVLTQDKDFGRIYLDADSFTVDNIIVKAGGILMPKGDRKVKFIGANTILKANDNSYRAGNVPSTFLLTDIDFKPIKTSQLIFQVKPKDIEKLDSTSQLIRIKLEGKELDSLKGLTKELLTNCTIKLAFWYLCADVNNIYLSDEYLYGNVDTSYNYKKISNKLYKSATVCLFNFPSKNFAYLNSDGALIYKRNKKLRMFPLCKGLVLTGDNKLTINDIEFFGFDNAVSLAYRKTSNKTIENCTFKYCNKGITYNNGAVNYPANVEVNNCTFADMIGNECITLYGCDNVKVNDNLINGAGAINKGGSAIGVAGKNYEVKRNQLYRFSYIGIRVGNTREYDKLRITGVVAHNLIDNIDNYNKPEKCLCDGGGIYIFTHQDSTVVKDNVIRNIGWVGGYMRGIFMDDGAYNTTVEGNLIYNILDANALDSREVVKYKYHNSNNHFYRNVVSGVIKVAGTSETELRPTSFEWNMIDGKEEISSNVLCQNNKTFNATIKNDKLVITDTSTFEYIEGQTSSWIMDYITFK